MGNKVVGYLQTYNDWEFLGSSLSSIENVVDEIVVVDGCYSWLSDYYVSRGFRPDISNDIVYDIIEDSRIPYKKICRIWGSQIEKRVAGYQACDADYVMRIDSDEIVTFDFKRLENFFSGGFSVCGMEMPTYVTGNLIAVGNGENLPIQNFIYKKDSISALDHLEYMWLVLTRDVIGGSFDEERVCPLPVAYNMHLTGMRSLITSTNRAAYYFTNWMRKNGFPFLSEFNYPPVDDFRFLKDVFSKIGCDNFYELLVTDKVSLGIDDILNNSRVIKISDRLATLYYDSYIESFYGFYKNKNYYLFVNSKEMFFDITHPDSRNLFFPESYMQGNVDVDIANVMAYFLSIDQNGLVKKEYLRVETSGRSFRVYGNQPGGIADWSMQRLLLSVAIGVADQDFHRLYLK